MKVKEEVKRDKSSLLLLEAHLKRILMDTSLLIQYASAYGYGLRDAIEFIMEQIEKIEKEVEG